MSFTFAHVAAVIPLLETKTKDGNNLFNATALIIGSMAPDFEFYIKMQPVKQTMTIPFGHTLGGMFCLDLPLCFLFAWIFHTIIKTPLILHLPQPFSQRYAKFVWQAWTVDWRFFLVFCYSAVAAMTIHIFWDSLTHINSPVVQYSSLLSQSPSLLGHAIPLCKLLDHSGTLIGLAVVLYFLGTYKRKASFDTVTAVSSWRKIVYFSAISGISMMVALCWLYRYGVPADSSEIAGPIIAVISGLFIGIAVMSFFAAKMYHLEPAAGLSGIKTNSAHASGRFIDIKFRS